MPNNDFDNDFLDNDSDLVTVKDHPPAPDSPDFASSSKKGYKSDVEPKVYMDLLRKPNRPDKHIKNFDFTLEDFENLCSVWTPKKDFTLLLHCSASDLDKFCNIAYNMNFNDTYANLIGVANLWARRAISNLAQRGNNTAMACLIKHFMKLDDVVAPQPSVTIINDLGSGKYNDKNNNK